MSNIIRKIIENIEAFKDYPEVYKYFVKDQKCIVCKHNINKAFHLSEECNREIQDQKTKQLEPSNTKTSKRNDRSILNPKLDVDFLIWMHYLGIAEFKTNPNKNLKVNELRSSGLSKIEIYCKFLACLDLSSQPSSIKIFDLDIFSKALNLNIKDEVFADFINKLVNDSFVYEKPDKIKGLNIEIFTFSYLSRNNLETRALRRRIEEHAFLFKADPKYSIELTNDIFIDKMILQLRENTLDLYQAIFLNQIYLNVSKDKEYFDLFHKLLIDSIRSIDQELVFSFIKHVFTFRTVLFSCIQEEQLVKLILSFYKKANRIDNTIGILLALYNTLPCLHTHEYISNELKEACLKTKKYSKTLKILELRSLINLKDLKELIITNKDSFDCLFIIYQQIKLISTYISNQKEAIQIIELCLELFSNMKSEFIERFINLIVNIILEMLSQITIDNSFLNFNLKYWNILSDLILAAQKENLNEKKKKQSTTYQSERCKSSLKLASVLYNLEDQMISKGFENVLRLKKRGFKIE